jgi:hemoglobin-like flavoprotein
VTHDPLEPEAARRIRLRYDRWPPAALSTAFFEQLAAAMPEARQLLPEDLTPHIEKVEAALALVIRNLGDLRALERPLEELGAHHASFGVSAERLAAAHRLLLDAVRTLAGRRWSRLDEQDWSAAFAALLAPMIRGATAARASAQTSSVRPDR